MFWIYLNRASLFTAHLMMGLNIALGAWGYAFTMLCVFLICGALERGMVRPLADRGEWFNG